MSRNKFSTMIVVATPLSVIPAKAGTQQSPPLRCCAGGASRTRLCLLGPRFRGDDGTGVGLGGAKPVRLLAP